MNNGGIVDHKERGKRASWVDEGDPSSRTGRECTLVIFSVVDINHIIIIVGRVILVISTVVSTIISITIYPLHIWQILYAMDINMAAFFFHGQSYFELSLQLLCLKFRIIYFY